MSEQTLSREVRLQEVLAEYLEQVEAGRNPDREEWLARYPDLATDLRSFLAENEKMRRLVQQQQEATLGFLGSDGSLGLGAKIRYFGDYELLEEIARGGMGVVFKARQASLNRVVAVKMILAGQLASEAEVLRFRAEAEAAANLDHPHIVPIYEVGEHQGQHYFSMKLIEGGSLIQRVPLLVNDSKVAANLLSQVARAVHHAHQRGILHRDLKPGNILIDAKGQPLVTDFGLAKRVAAETAQTRTGAVVGTPSYMAPEQASAQKQLTTAVDVYSLGAILYELLTAQPPFKGEHPIEVLMQVVEKEPVRPSAIKPSIDRDLETICLKCLEKDPGRRYGSAGALADDLDCWLRDEPIAARPVSRTEKSWRWCRRNPILAGLWTVVLLAFLTMSLGAWWAAWRFNRLAGQEQAARQAADEMKATAEEQRERALRERERAEGERDAKSKALKNAEALRLTALSQVALATNPGKALTLAVEGSEHAEPRTAAHNNAIVAALEKLREKRRFDAPQVQPRIDMKPKLCFTSVAYSRDGKYLAGTTSRARLDGHLGGTWDENQVLVWNRETGGILKTFRVPGLSIVKVVFSPNGRQLATLHEGYGLVEYADKQQVLHTEQAVRLWDVSTGKELHVLGGHEERVTFIQFSLDGKLAATGGWDGVARIWEVETGKLLHQLKPTTPEGSLRTGLDEKTGKLIQQRKTDQGSLRTVLFSHDGKRALTISEGLVHHSAAETSAGSERVFFPTERNPLIRTDAKIEIVQTYGGWSGSGINFDRRDDQLPAHLWDLTTGKEIAMLRLPKDAKEEQATTVNACFDDDGKQIITAHWGDGDLRVWDAVTGKHKATWTPSISNVYRLRPGASQVWCIGADSDISIRDVITGKETGRWKAFDHGFRAIRWSEDQPHVLFVGSAQNNDKELHWTIGQRQPGRLSPPEHGIAVHFLSSSGEQIGLLQGHEDEIVDAQFAPGGFEVATASMDGTLRLWSLRGKDVYYVSKMQGGISAVAFDKQGLFSASHDGTVRKRDVWSFRDLAVLEHSGIDPSKHGLQKPLLHVEVSPDQERVVSLASDYFVRRTFDKSKKPDPKVPFTPVKLWDAKTGKLLHALQGFTCDVRSVSFSPDGQKLMTVSEGRMHYLYLNEKDEHRGSGGSGGKDLGVRIWNALDGKMIASLPVEFYCRAAVWSPDGQRIATSDPLKIWDTATQKEVLSLERHDVDKMLWTADGRWIVGWQKSILSQRQRVVLWNAATGKIEHRLDDHAGDVLAVVASAKGDRVAVSTAEGKVHLWDLANGNAIHTYDGFKQPVCRLAFSNTGRWLAVGCKDGMVHLWETARRDEWLTISAGTAIEALSFSPDDRWLAVGTLGGPLYLWPTDPLAVAQVHLHPR